MKRTIKLIRSQLIKTFKSLFERTINVQKVIVVAEYSIKLWLLTLVIPLTITILLIFFSILLGFQKFSLEFWRYYYYDGYLCDIISWRIHLGILLVCFLYMINKVFEE